MFVHARICAKTIVFDWAGVARLDNNFKRIQFKFTAVDGGVKGYHTIYRAVFRQKSHHDPDLSALLPVPEGIAPRSDQCPSWVMNCLAGHKLACPDFPR